MAVRFDAWRGTFLAGGVLLMVGGANHPRGTMVDMLAHHDWLWSHVLFTLGFVGLLAGLVSLQRQLPADAPLGKWTRAAVWIAVLQSVEAVMHTAAVVDAAHLAADAATPVLTVHLWMAVAIYPVFGAVLIAFMAAAARARIVGSPWITWLGAIGAAAHGLSAPLTIVFEIPWAPILFPMVMLLAIWMVLAAVWPSRAPALSAAPAA